MEFRRAKAYASEYRGNNPKAHFFNTRLQRVSELLENFDSGRVLDIGCGPGIIGNTFRGRPIEYYGVDISEEMIKECKDTFGNDPQYRFSLGRTEELPFPESSFDVVLCLGVFEYVMDVHIAMKEIERVLKPKGIVIATMLNRLSPYRIWQRFVYWKIKMGVYKIMCLIKRRSHDQGTEKCKMTLYSEAAFRHLLTSGGLEIEDVVYYDFNLFLSPMDSLFPRASVFLSRKLEFLCRSKWNSLGTGFILKCRKNEHI
jgi:ubiquinone/menaquinone biosynthesis C-methylase UbiE